MKTVCPVTGAFQYIPAEVLAARRLVRPRVPDGLRGRRLLPARLPGRVPLPLRAGDHRDPPRVAVPLAAGREAAALARPEPARSCAASGRTSPSPSSPAACDGRAVRRPVGRRELLSPRHAAGAGARLRLVRARRRRRRMSSAAARCACAGGTACPRSTATTYSSSQTPAQDGWLDLIPRAAGRPGRGSFYDIDYDLHAFATGRRGAGAGRGAGRALRRCASARPSRSPSATARSTPTRTCARAGSTSRAYALTRPPHDTVNIGWSGRTLQYDEMRAWLAQVASVLRARPVANFVSVGEPYGDVAVRVGRGRHRSAACRSRSCCPSSSRPR